MSNPSHQWLHLRWPYQVKAEQDEAAFRALNGLSTRRRREALVLHAVGHGGEVSHYVAVPVARAAAVINAVRQAIPGLSVEPCPAPDNEWNTTWVIWMSTRRRPLRTTESESLSNGLIGALSGVYGNEAVALTWTLGPVRRPIAVPNKAHTGHGDTWQQYIPIGVNEIDNEARGALMKKQSEPGWRVAGRLYVRAATRDRQLQLLQRVAGALRAAQGSGVQIGGHRALFRTGSDLPWRRPLALNVNELVGLAAWPIGELEALPIERTASRLVPVPRTVARSGRVIGESSYPGQKRPVALGAVDSLSHGWIIGPTGSGKSELLARLCVQDIEAGRAVVVVDPKGDLVKAILGRIPDHRRDDVVVLDPADEAHPVGLNPLAQSRRHPELVADQLLHLFHRLSDDAWGPRIGDVLHAALLTMAQQPEANLCALPLLLSDPTYRRQVISRLDDPFGLGPFWAAFNALSENERQQTIAPVMRRLRQLLLRPRVRGVLGQTHPRFEMHQVLTERKILLVSLAKGLIGPEASSLLGSLVVSQLWGAVLGRVAIPQERRNPVMVFLDEVQDQVHGVTDVGDMFVQARGLGIGITVAHQHLGQLDPSLRGVLSANARSRVIFQTSNEDASFFARGQSVLRAEDFQRLPQYEAYASLLSGGHVTPYSSVRTLPLGPITSDADDIRELSRARYGRPANEVEAELRTMLTTAKPPGSEDFGVIRRSS